MISRVTAIATVLFLAAATRPACAQVTDIIRGRVTDPQSQPIDGARVRVTSSSGQVTKTATTNDRGAFTVIFINGEGDYWIEVTRLGFAPRRYEVRKVGDEEVIIADTRMPSTIATLDTLNTVSERARLLPNRNGSAADVGGGDRTLTNAVVPPDQAGNLAAMAGAVPGFQLIPGLDGAPDMYSVLGLSGDQNNITFNGLGSGINTLPPDVLATTSINAYPFDVSKGGFSGAQITVQTIPGSNFSRRAITTADVGPPLEFADAAASALGQRYTSVRVGGNAAGPISFNDIFYSGAWNVSRRFSTARTALNTSADGLETAGIAPDSVARLTSILGSLQAPSVAYSVVPSLQAQDLVQAVGNLDIMPSASGTGHSFTLGAVGNLRRIEPVSRGGLIFATPSHGGEVTSVLGSATITHTNYFGFGVLEKSTMGVATERDETAPLLTVPEGQVRIASTLADGSAAIRTLSFGGSGMQATSRTGTVQASNQLSWFSMDNAHTIKLTSNVAYDAFGASTSMQSTGTFSYNSLADLAAGTPSSFARTESPLTQHGEQLIAAVSLGDYWRPRDGVQVQYGIRADANRFLVSAPPNALLQSTFGVDNSHDPSDIYVSPRIGVQWRYGEAPQVAYAPGAARPPQAVIHFGAGVFQNITTSQLIAPALRETGLAGSATSLLCVGSATPFPQWSEFVSDPASVPTQCSGSSSTFAAGAPNVSLFDRSFKQPRSLRTAGDWSGPVLGNRFVLGVQGIASSGQAQQGMVDLNVSRTPSFTLPAEANRPIYADVSAIVPATGSTAGSSDRISSGFQHVWSYNSALSARSTQLTVNLKPVTANAFMRWDLTYTLLNVREQYYGFTSTAGDPFAISWGDHLQTPRHSVLLRWNDVPLSDYVYVTTVLQLMSGVRYTPQVAQDENGDGALNDRAFVPSPLTGDSATAAAMRALLASTTPQARACLTSQLGAIAARGSCQGPWVLSNAVQLKLNPIRLGIPKRATVTLTVFNPLGIVDLALHGANGVRGWGQNLPPDDNLLFIRGFDPASRQFHFDVNQRFGSTRPSESVVHTVPYLTLSVNVDIGVPRERQMLTQHLNQGRSQPGTRDNAEMLKALGTNSIPNPMAMIMQQDAALHLTRVQADSLANLSRKFSVFADSVWTPEMSYLAALPDGYDHGEAYARYVSARERTVDYLLTLVPSARELLTSSQLRQLPPQVSVYLDSRVLRFLRSSTVGSVLGP